MDKPPTAQGLPSGAASRAACLPPAERGLPSPLGPGDSNDNHFATAHLLSDLKGRTISSGVVTMASQGVQFFLNLASIMILARLLAPHDFGLIAMVTSVTGFLRVFNDAGLSTATVQKESITHAQVSNLFWTNVALGGTVSLILAVSAPVVAWFYREPKLVGVTLALCVTFLLTSSAVQHLALLKRQMRFKMIAFIQIGSMAAGVAVGVGLAALKCGYWSLVWMQLTTTVTASLLTWSASRWRPQLPERGSGTRPLLHFGANLTASSFIWSFSRGSDSLLIGRFYGSVPLGLYSRAAALLSRPMDQLITPIEAVLVPTLCRLQPQPERYRKTVFRVYDIIAVTCFPFAALFLALAHPLTLVVLGRKWEDAAPILAGFSFVALFMPAASVASWLITSQGRGRDFLVQSLIGSSLIVVSFLVGLPFGPAGVAISYSAFSILIALPIVYHVAGRRGPVTARDLWGLFWSHVPLWGVVCGATWLVRGLVGGLSPLAQLMVCAPAGLLAGAAFAFVYPPSHRAVAELVDALRKWSSLRAAHAG